MRSKRLTKKGIQVEAFKKAYQEFKTVVRSIGEEKRLGREFEEASGYSLYRVVQASKNATKIIRMEGLKNNGFISNTPISK